MGSIAWTHWPHHLSIRDPWVRFQRIASLDIVEAIDENSYKLAAIKLITPSQEHLEKHCALKAHHYNQWHMLTKLPDEDLSSKPFFPGLIKCTPQLTPPVDVSNNV